MHTPIEINIGRGLRKNRCGVWKALAWLLMVGVAAAGAIATYSYLKQKETEMQTKERIQPLIAGGLSENQALAFDSHYSSMAPYDNTEVNYAKNLWLPYVTTGQIAENNALYILQNYPQLLATQNVLLGDFDTDNLTNQAEIFVFGTNPTVGDSDNDNLSDGLEVSTYKTNPLVSDTDGDNLSDYAEVSIYHTNPLIADSDNDGLSDGREVELGTDPLSPDTDKDGIWDGYEVDNMAQYGANPLRRDIFVEIDRTEDGGSEWWQQTRWLTENEKSALVSVFENAPIQNPDGSWGVDLHLIENDIVPYANIWLGGEYGIVDENLHYKAYSNYKENYRDFGEGFYYCVLMSGGTFCYDSGFTSIAPPETIGTNVAYYFMHELGHSLGLVGVFDGIDSGKYTFEEYPSVMNYNTPGGIWYPITFLGYSSSGVFNDWGYLQEHGFKLHEYWK